ncbi:MAG: pseudouridine synthase [Rhizobiaceae bacterium]|nr:pseudouridine synthase [Rhizobiaceae bacterium]
MDDNRKKPSRGKPQRPIGSKRPAKGGDGGKFFRKSDGPRPFARREDGERSERPRFNKEGGDRFGGSDRPRFKREDGERSERPRFNKEGGNRFGGSDRPRFKREDGERSERPRFSKEGGERFGGSDRPRFKREDGERSERPRFNKEGGDRFGGSDRPRFKREDGERSERPRFNKEGGNRFAGSDRPRFKREDGERSERPRFNKEGGDRFGGSDRPRFKREDGERSERPRFSGSRSRPESNEDWSEGERIAKRLARAGISSRRDAESLIVDGRVRVNGKLVESPALNVSASDRIEVDGKEIPAIERTRLFLFHKPSGVVTTNRDPEGRKTVFDILPENLPRLMTVGRLDINTEGLLLLTNDGGLARVLELPATGWLRRYRVRVHGEVDEARLASLQEGIAVEGVFYGAVEAVLERTQGTNAWLTLGLREGKNREVKNILGALGLEVTRLIRVSYGPFQLGELPEGHVMEIKGRTLREQLGDTLIEESGANFDADILQPFPNKPVRRGGEGSEPRAAERRPREMTVGEGGLVKGGFRRDRDRDRERPLDRLTTKGDRKPFGPKPFGSKPPRDGKRGERDEKPVEERGPRKANVWMAPGARPQAKRPSERAAERRERDGEGQQRSRPPFRKDGKRFDRPGGAPRGPGGGGRPPRKG